MHYKCAGPKHNADNCKFNFYKPCSKCSVKSHFIYLCLSQLKSRISNKNNPNIKNVNANCLTLCSDRSEDVILPTFTVSIANGTIIKALKDTGCTNCSVKKSLAKQLKCEVLSKIKVSINGMSINRLYDAEVVKLQYFIGDSLVTVNVITFENISI